MDGDNLPPPSEAVALCKMHNIKKMRIFEPNEDVLSALKGSNIELMLGVPNDDIEKLADPSFPRIWVQKHVLDYIPDVKFRYIAMGDEIMPQNAELLQAPFVLPAMRNIHDCLSSEVLSSVSGIQASADRLTQGEVLLIVCVILVGLFALQHIGTHRVAFLFAPVVFLWLISIFAIGLYNTIHWNPRIVYALSPHYIVKFFRETGKDGWVSLGGVLLAITGTEAMFADLGHFTAISIRIAFAFAVYPCLVVQYMGQAAFLSKNVSSIPNSFYHSIPDSVYWPIFVIATLAAIVGSQAIISATFSIVKQCNALGCFPRVKVVHTSRRIYGQIYIPEINWILMIITLSIAIRFQDTTTIGNAYGLACMTVMFITTFLMSLVLVFVWQRNLVFAAAFLLFFWFIEGVYLSAAFIKVPQGGWVSLVLSFVFLCIMFVCLASRNSQEVQL